MNKQAGFSLLEVMISVVIAGIALLGLAAAQLKSLQYATNSFNYTVSLIQGQNTIERLWPRICEIQKTNPALFQDVDFRASLAPQVADYQITIPAIYNDDMQINEVINNHKPNYSISEYIALQNKRMGNDFNDYTS